MTKPKTDKALEVLKALDEWYRVATDGPSLYARLFEDDRNLQEHIREAIVALEPERHP